MSSSPEDVDIRYTQNCLKSRRLVEHLLERSSVGTQDLVVEIGPGKGKITKCLAARCRRVIAVEKDGELAQRLGRTLAGDPRVEVCQADFLSFSLPREPYKVFANIPFNITTAIVTKLARSQRSPEDCYLIVQREAAERFCGILRESLYALLLKPWFEPSIVHRFKREDFVPSPRVDVVMLRLRKRGPPLITTKEAQKFRDFVVHTFVNARPGQDGVRIGNLTTKQSRYFLSALGSGPSSRLTEIRFEQWLQIFHRFVRLAPSTAWRHIAGSERKLVRQQASLRKRHRTIASSKSC